MKREWGMGNGEWGRLVRRCAALISAPLISTGLQPGVRGRVSESRFNGFPVALLAERELKTVETVSPRCRSHTRLKPGANEKRHLLAPASTTSRLPPLSPIPNPPFPSR